VTEHAVTAENQDSHVGGQQRQLIQIMYGLGELWPQTRQFTNRREECRP